MKQSLNYGRWKPVDSLAQFNQITSKIWFKIKFETIFETFCVHDYHITSTSAVVIQSCLASPLTKYIFIPHYICASSHYSPSISSYIHYIFALSHYSPNISSYTHYICASSHHSPNIPSYPHYIPCLLSLLTKYIFTSHYITHLTYCILPNTHM